MRIRDLKFRAHATEIFVIMWMTTLNSMACHNSSKPVDAGGGTKSAASSAELRAAIPAQARFLDKTASAGVHFAYRNGNEAGRAAILESLGGGVGLLDYDGDGYLDIFFPGGGEFGDQREIRGLPSTLYRNDGTWHYVDVTAAAGAGRAPYYSHGAAVGDCNQDGFPDVLLTGYGGLQFFANQGDGTFLETHEQAGLTDQSWSSSAAWGDVNGDGHLDLYVAHYVNWSFDNDPACPGPAAGQREVCSPRRFDPLPDTLYFSNGDGTFRDASREAGLVAEGKGLGVLLADVDLDGDLDIYVANDTVPNFLYRNDGRGRLEEVGQFSGTALSESGTADGSMGVAFGDFNLDGLPDIWVANFERESFALYRNEGNGYFQHVSRPMGITAVGALFVGFGTVSLDFDRDGDEDVFVANGHVIHFPENAPLRQTPLLFENLAGKRMQNVAPSAGPYFAAPHLGRGVARGDLDRDGDLDLVVAHTNESAALLDNASSDPNGWLQVRLIGVRSNRDAVGARLTLETSAGTQIRQVTGGGSYLSHSDLSPFWGIPAGALLKKLTIRWPSGAVQVLDSPQPNRELTLIEPAAPAGTGD